MNGPDYNRSEWNLLDLTEGWALFESRTVANTSMISRYVDFDWEFYDRGDTAEMEKEYRRVTKMDDGSAINVIDQESGETVTIDNPEVSASDLYADNPNFGRF